MKLLRFNQPAVELNDVVSISAEGNLLRVKTALSNYLGYVIIF